MSISKKLLHSMGSTSSYMPVHLWYNHWSPYAQARLRVNTLLISVAREYEVVVISEKLRSAQAVPPRGCSIVNVVPSSLPSIISRQSR